MPVLVGDLRDQVGDGLRVVLMQHVAQRPAMGAQAHAQLFLGVVLVARRFLGADGQRVQRPFGAGFGSRARLGAGGFQNAAVLAGEVGFHAGFLQSVSFETSKTQGQIITSPFPVPPSSRQAQVVVVDAVTSGSP